MIGRTLAHYKILEKIGSGGMGEVYLAEDTKLDRKVALKVLPPELAESEERRARFKREAKAVAALNHPNIVTVFSVEEDDGVHFITMELVKGKTVTELLPKTGFPLSKFFEVAIPLANAVAAAHQEGITHRDLKPDNMMVGDDGRVKVLDFGLAKPTSGFAGGDADSALPTVAKTAEGVIVRTVNYMSPEQAQGKAVDARSDIFSFGVVLYEMLTGRRPFGGETPAEILSSIIKDTPESTSDLNPAIPRDLAKLVMRCLAKDPIRRYQSAVDLRNDLEESKQELDSGETVSVPLDTRARSPWLQRLAWAIGGAAGILLLLWAGGWLGTRAEGRRSVPRLTNAIQVTSAIGVETAPTWSPDGRALAYAAAGDIWATSARGGEPVNRTEDPAGNNQWPAWSPDGEQIAYWSNRDGGGYFVMPALGGAPRKVISVSARRPVVPAWSGDGQTLTVVDREEDDVVLKSVSLASRESSSVLLRGVTVFRFDPTFSPDGRTVAYVDATARGADVTRLWVMNLESRRNLPVTNGQTKVWRPSWSRDGRTLYFISNRGGTMDLWQQSIGSDGVPDGDPLAVTVGIEMRDATFSPDGAKLAYSRGRTVANLWRVPVLAARPATWSDAEQLTFDRASVGFADISRDGRTLLFDSDRSGNLELYKMSLMDGETVQLTTSPSPDGQPRLSPDGEEVMFYSYRSGNRDIWILPLNGDPARQVTDGRPTGSEFMGTAWSPDGTMVATGRSQANDTDIQVISIASGEVRAITTSPAEEDWWPIWSLDGKDLFFTNRRGLWAMPMSGGEPRFVSESAYAVTHWSKDGKRLFFGGRGDKSGDFWSLDLDDLSERRLTVLEGRRGRLSQNSLGSDGVHLYFSWREDFGDIWVMDVVTDESE